MAKEIRHVVWDWNGTLLDDVHVCVGVVNGILQRRGLPGLNLRTYRAKFDFPVERYYARIGLGQSGEPLSRISDEFITEYERRRHECRLRAGVIRTLAELSAAGVQQSVVSAYPQPSLKTALVQFGIRDFFAHVVGNENHLAEGKLAQGRVWLRRTGCASGCGGLIGDTTHDATLAGELGLCAVLVTGGHQSRRRLEASGWPVCASVSAAGRRMLRALHGART